MRAPSPSYCRLDLAPPLADRFIFGVAPIDYSPLLLLMPFGFHLAMDNLPSGESLLRPTTHYRRLWIWRPSFERQRDFNPPEQRAAQRTLWGRKTTPASVRASSGRPLVAPASRPIAGGGPPGVRADGELSSVPGPSLWSMPWAKDPGESAPDTAFPLA